MKFEIGGKSALLTKSINFRRENKNWKDACDIFRESTLTHFPPFSLGVAMVKRDMTIILKIKYVRCVGYSGKYL